MDDLNKVIAWLADTELYYQREGITSHDSDHQCRMAHDAIELLKYQKDALEQMGLDNQDLRQCHSEMTAEIERLKSTLGIVITPSSFTLTATGDAKQGEKRGLEFGKAYMKEHIEKELLYKHLLTDEIKEIIERIN